MIADVEKAKEELEHLVKERNFYKSAVKWIAVLLFLAWVFLR
ncbi:MAG TPA: hypothetical protein VJB11_00590 [archaeon]|nr:hypothetical protein [archaeon]